MYGKLFASMYEGSLYGQWQALVTFQQMIVLADCEGRVDMTPQALAARTSIPFEIIEKGIALLEAPDSYSRSADHDGRRIVRVDAARPWGWEIVNYKYYRNLATAEDKRRADRERIAAKRAVSQPVAKCRDLSVDVANVAYAEAEAEAEGEVKEKNPPTPRGRGARRCPDSFELTPELRALSVELPPDFDLDGETAKFRDCEFAKPRTDWPAAWRTWMRKARDQRSYAKRAASAATIRQPPTAEAISAARETAARQNAAQLAKVMPRLTP